MLPKSSGRMYSPLLPQLWNSQHQPADVAAALDDTLAELQLEYLDLFVLFLFKVLYLIHT